MLQFVVELIIVRNYAFAVVFITPLALIIAESGQPNMPVSTLIGARLLDTLLGSAIGLMGAFLWRNFDKEKLADWRVPLLGEGDSSPSLLTRLCPSGSFSRKGTSFG
ncbi:hypothetical protein GCM10020331_002180 [Ectobacillus funiculus]